MTVKSSGTRNLRWMANGKRELAVQGAKVCQCAQSKCGSKHFAKFLLSFVFLFYGEPTHNNDYVICNIFNQTHLQDIICHISWIQLSCSSSLYHAQVPYITRFCTYYIIPALTRKYTVLAFYSSFAFIVPQYSPLQTNSLGPYSVV